MATNPIFAATPRASFAALSLAETLRTAPANVGVVFTAGANGSRLERVVVQATGTTTAGFVRLFIYNGSTYSLIKEIPVTALTPSGTVAAFVYELDCSAFSALLCLPNGYSLRATTHNAENFAVTAFGGDY